MNKPTHINALVLRLRATYKLTPHYGKVAQKNERLKVLKDFEEEDMLFLADRDAALEKKRKKLEKKQQKEDISIAAKIVAEIASPTPIKTKRGRPRKHRTPTIDVDATDDEFDSKLRNATLSLLKE